MHFLIGAAVEFKGIVFALLMDMNALVACDLDASGILNAHWVLDELSELNMSYDMPSSSVGSILVPAHVPFPIDDEMGSGGNE
ncbi:hypothetical protein MRB53_010315 [Persea americana]|uniref:Uncharacterized protein n=1 Tax=Persea americana TaxID=3435 RepID=A0ACC2LS83_PERAE|nr:hypothetical protein MRB53_010315 [Persea americana]